MFITLKKKFNIAIIFTFIMMLVIMSVVFATEPVTDLAELQTALAGEEDEIIVSNVIILTDETVLDGNGKTVRVETPYVKEDGTLESSPSSSNVFEIDSDAHVTIKNMTIMGGYLGGYGAIYSRGYLTMENVNVVQSNRGIDNSGTIAILKNCNFSLNVAKSAAAIWSGNGADLILDGCSFSKNHSNGGSSSGGGAIGVSGSSSTLYANNTIFANNATQEIGGAINIYDGNVYLMNCTFVGNGTEKSTSCGGGIGKNGGKLYAVNCILVDNYAQIDSTVARNDFAIYSGSSNIGLFNCLYGSSDSAGTNCIIDTSNETFNSYVSEGIIRYDGSLSTSFTHPELFEGDNEYDLYPALDKNSPALTGGIATYFDYSDTSNIKMGFGDEDDITGLGDLSAPTSNSKVTTYFEGDTREDDVIGASNVALETIATWEQLATKLANGGTVTLTQDITSPSSGGELTIPEGVTTILDLNGHIIDRNNHGRALWIEGDLTITDSDPDAEHDPAITYTNPITDEIVTVKGGIITGANYEMAIRVSYGGTLTLNGGSITGNTCRAIYLSGSTFNMNGGTLSNNVTDSVGSGVWVYESATMNMTGGVICHNVTTNGKGAGFYLYNNQSKKSKLYLSGGTITENQSSGSGGGVYVDSNGGVLYVSGNPVVQENYKDSTENNIVGPGDRFVNIFGEMTDGAHVGVTTASVPTLDYSATFTYDYKTYNEENDPENYFFSDYGEEILTGLDYGEEAAFIYPVTTWEELRTSFGHYGGIKLTSDIKASATDTRIELGWCETRLDLNGHVIDCSAMTSNTNAFATTNSHAVLTIVDSNPTATHTPALSYIDPITDEEIVIKGGIITGRPDGVFTGTEINCQSGAVVMKGGTILGKSTPGGCAVYLTYESAHFYMDNGTICGNNSSTDGGGITNIQGTIHLNGGAITGNTASGNGGGIINGYGKLFITGGEITNNVSVGDGAGIYQSDNSNSAISISGKPIVTGNKKGEEDSNIYLSNKAITISEALEDGASMGVTTQTVPTMSAPVTITSGFNTYNSDDDPTDYFVSDKEYEVITSNDEVALKGGISTWSELQNALNTGGTITLMQDIVAESTDTMLYVDKEVTLDLNGYIIDRNLQTATQDGGVFFVDEPGNLIINDSRPNATHSPEITYKDLLTNEDVVVTGGVITGGYNNRANGGIYFKWASGTINGGTIVGNKALGVDIEGNAGGIVIYCSSVTMNGGAIVGNEALYGDNDTVVGGVCIKDLQGGPSALNMNGGKITGNFTDDTDGSCLGGIYVYAGNLNVSGDAFIDGNMKDDENSNIILTQTQKGRAVHVVGSLTDGAHFSVTPYEIPIYYYSPVEFTTDYQTYLSGEEPSTYFSLDEDRAFLVYDGTSELKVALKYTLTITDDGNGTASGDMTDFYYSLHPTLTATPNEGYQFKEWQVISGNVSISDSKVYIGTEPDADNPATDVQIKAVFEEIPVPTILCGSVCRTSAEQITLKFNSNCDGQYIIVVTNNDTVPTIDNLINDDTEAYTDGEAYVGTNTVTLYDLTSGSKYIHMYLYSDGYSEPVTISVPYDVYYYEDFEVYPVDTYIADGALSPINQENNGAGDTEQKVVADDTTKYLQLCSARSGQWASDQTVSWENMIPTTGMYVFEGDIKPEVTSSDTNWLLSFFLFNGTYGGGHEAGICFEDGKIYDISKSHVIKNSFSNDEWYHIKIECFPETAVYNIYLNDEKMASDLTLPTGINKMAISSGHRYLACFDNLVYYADPTYEAQPTAIEAVTATLTLPNVGDTVTGSSANNQTPTPVFEVSGDAVYELGMGGEGPYSNWYTDVSTLDNTLFSGDFVSGGTYYALVFFNPKENGYIFSGDIDVTINKNGSGDVEVVSATYDDEHPDEYLSVVVKVTLPVIEKPKHSISFILNDSDAVSAGSKVEYNSTLYGSEEYVLVSEDELVSLRAVPGEGCTFTGTYFMVGESMFNSSVTTGDDVYTKNFTMPNDNVSAEFKFLKMPTGNIEEITYDPVTVGYSITDLVKYPKVYVTNAVKFDSELAGSGMFESGDTDAFSVSWSYAYKPQGPCTVENMFSICPKAGLSAGTYTMTYGFKYGSEVFDTNVVTFTVNEPTVIDTITITGITEPEDGDTPPAISTTTEGLTITSYRWEDVATGEEATVFEAGKDYTLTVYFSADSGYVVNENYTVNVEGYSVGAVLLYDNYFITGLTVPRNGDVSGETPGDKPSSGGSSSGSSSGGGGGSSSGTRVKTTMTNGKVKEQKVEGNKKAREYTFIPEEGYKVTDVIIDGVSVGAVNSFIIEDATKKHTIEVKTEEIKPWSNVDEWAKEEMEKAKEAELIPETMAGKDFTTAISRNDFAAVAVKLYEALSGKKAEPVAVNPFTDTNDEYVLKAYNLGITNGVSETEFDNRQITREQMATMIARALTKAGIDVAIDLNTVTKFDDDNLMSDWGRPSVYFMASKEIIKGVGENRFNPLGNAKVEEAIAVALRSVEIFGK